MSFTSQAKAMQAKSGAEAVQILQQVQNSVTGMVYAFASLKSGQEELGQGTERLGRASAEADVYRRQPFTNSSICF